jgi:hypothetical protein
MKKKKIIGKNMSSFTFDIIRIFGYFGGHKKKENLINEYEEY